MKKQIALLALIFGFMTTSLVHAQQPPVATDSKFPLFTTIAAAQHHCPFDVIVWLNTKADTYSLSSPKPGDANEAGAYMCQREADQMDYHHVELPAAPQQ